MGQKVNPIGFRLGYIRKPDSNWFASAAVYAENLMEDEKIRAYLAVRVAKASVSRVLIERAGKKITITHSIKKTIMIDFWPTSSFSTSLIQIINRHENMPNFYLFINSFGTYLLNVFV